jgi:hypothetical protein
MLDPFTPQTPERLPWQQTLLHLRTCFSIYRLQVASCRSWDRSSECLRVSWN